MKTKTNKFFKIFLLSIFIIFCVGIAAACFIFAKITTYAHQIPLNKEKLLNVYNAVELYDHAGGKIENKSLGYAPVRLGDLPPYVAQVLITTEDKEFYKHKGFNYKRMVGATVDNIKSGRIKEGASTISQQLVKNVYLNNEKTFNRKLKEYALTQKLEKNFSKDSILEIYLNTVYFGSGAYGIEAAARIYFDKSATELSLNEAAGLVGVLCSPRRYSPILNYDNFNKRKDFVLSEMLKDKKITNEEFAANAGKFAVLIKDKKENNFLAYENAVLQEACHILHLNKENLLRGKFKIYTYYNPQKQAVLADELKQASKNISAEKGGVLIDVQTGGICSFAGASNLYTIKRQPGSCIKPVLVYAPALEYNLLAPATPILDERINYENFAPQNANKRYSGYMSMKDALAQSTNVVAVKTLNYVGVSRAKNFAGRFGIEFADHDLGIALGNIDNGLTLQKMASPYLAFAADGNFVQPGFIKEILDASGRTVYKRNEMKKPVMRDDTAFLITDMLKQAVTTGTAKGLQNLNFDVASKTGTVGLAGEKNTDAYNFAYTKQDVLGVWVGSKNNEKDNLLAKNINGSTIPTRVACCVLEKIYKNKKPDSFTPPPSVEMLKIDRIELEENQKLVLANSTMPDRYTKTMYFSRHNTPNIVSKRFIEILPAALNLTQQDGKVLIKMHCKPFETYEIYKNNQLLTGVNNQNGPYTFIDDQVKNNTEYIYTIKTNTHNFASGEVLTATSPKNKIFVHFDTKTITAEKLKELTQEKEAVFIQPPQNPRQKEEKFNLKNLFKKIIKPFRSA